MWLATSARSRSPSQVGQQLGRRACLRSMLSARPAIARTRTRSRRQAVRRSRQPDEPEPRRQGRTAVALLCLSGRHAGAQARSRVRRPRPGAGDRTEAVRAVSSASNRQGRHELHQPEASGRGTSTDSPAVRPSDHDATLRAAIERVVMSRTTIEIEQAEGMASDDQNRILIIPWTPPSPHWRREIIQVEGERPCAVGPMRTEARAVLTDALRDTHRWLDELTHQSQPKNRIARHARRQN